jgi:hypothetical protein
MKTIAVVTVIVAAMANISAHAQNSPQPVAPGSNADQANMCWYVTDGTRNYGRWALCDDRAQAKKGKKKGRDVNTVYGVRDDTGGGGFNGGGGGGGGGGR